MVILVSQSHLLRWLFCLSWEVSAALVNSPWLWVGGVTSISEWLSLSVIISRTRVMSYFCVSRSAAGVLTQHPCLLLSDALNYDSTAIRALCTGNFTALYHSWDAHPTCNLCLTRILFFRAGQLNGCGFWNSTFRTTLRASLKSMTRPELTGVHEREKTMRPCSPFACNQGPSCYQAPWLLFFKLLFIFPSTIKFLKGNMCKFHYT